MPKKQRSSTRSRKPKAKTQTRVKSRIKAKAASPARPTIQDALEAEQEAEAHLPASGRRPATGLDLRQRLVEGGAASGSGSERLGGVLAGMEKGLSGPFLRTDRVGSRAIRRVRRECRVQYRF